MVTSSQVCPFKWKKETFQMNLAAAKAVYYLQASLSWTKVYWETTPAQRSERELNQQPPDIKSGTLTTWPHWLPML